MSIDIDTGSVTLTVEAKEAKCEFKAGSEALLLHCTKGASLAVADSPWNRGLMNSFSHAVIWKGKVRVRTTSNADARSELASRWAFGFLQFALIWVEEYVYAGWTPSNGSIQWNLKPAYSTNPCLDAGPRANDDTQWPIMSTDSKVRPAGPGQYDVECSHGDHPRGGAALRERNLLTHEQNYLYSARRDVSYWVVFVARDPSNVIRPLANFNFHTIWHAEMQWFRPQFPPPRVVIKDQKFLASGVSTGAPAEPSISALVARPTGPTANDQSDSADAVWQTRRAPMLSQFSTHMIGMREDFVGLNQPEY